MLQKAMLCERGRGLGAGGVGGTMVMDVTEHSLGTGGWDL